MKINDLDKYISDYDKTTQEFDKHNSVVAEMAKISAELDNLGHNVHHVVEAVTNKFNEVGGHSHSKKQELANLREALVQNETVCRSFSESAENFANFLEVQKTKASQASDQELEETIRILGEVSGVLESTGAEKMSELESLDNQIKARNIGENPFTSYSLRSLRTTYESFLTANKKKLDAANKELLAKQQTGVSSEEFADIKDAFDHFDHDKDGKLNALDFFGVLSFLGESPTEDSAKQILDQLDKDGDGKLSFEEYKDYIVSKRADRDTLDTYLESFKTIAGSKDFVTEDELRRYMPPDRVDFLISYMPRYENVENGYDYRKWLHDTYGMNI